MTHRAQSARDTMEAEVRRLHRELLHHASLLEVGHKSMVSARGWLTAAWDVYDAGFGDLREVLDALEQFWGTRVAHLRTVVAHNLLVVDLSRAVGVDITRPAEATR